MLPRHPPPDDRAGRGSNPPRLLLAHACSTNTRRRAEQPARTRFDMKKKLQKKEPAAVRTAREHGRDQTVSAPPLRPHNRPGKNKSPKKT
jgi:hypothetical protein